MRIGFGDTRIHVLSLSYGEYRDHPYLMFVTEDRMIIVTTGQFLVNSRNKSIERVKLDPRTIEAADALNEMNLAGVMDIREWLGVSLDIMGVS